MDIFNLAYELRKCTECSCSRCNLCGTSNCYVEIAIKELDRYDQAMSSMKIPAKYLEQAIDAMKISDNSLENP